MGNPGDHTVLTLLILGCTIYIEIMKFDHSLVVTATDFLLLTGAMYR